MKKQLLVALAAIGMVACQQNEVVEMPKSEAIAFEDAYVGKITKATPTSSFDSFKVYAFMSEDGVNENVFEGVEVVYNGAWVYEGTQYWQPNKTYYFAGIAPVSQNWTLASEQNANGAGSLTFTNNGTEDLVYAATVVETPETQKELVNEGMESVRLTFNHLLSKVKFTFVHNFDIADVDVTVSNIRLTAPKTATLDLTREWWTLGNGWEATTSDVMNFGNLTTLSLKGTSASSSELLVIPAANYTVTYDYVIKMGETTIATATDRTSEIKDVNLEMGKAYNFVANLGSDNVDLDITEWPINFDVVEKDWTAETEKEFNNSLQDMINNKSVVTLQDNWEADDYLVVTNDVVLDLNGKTITCGKEDSPEMTGSDISAIVVENGATLTIVGDGEIVGTEYGVYVKNGNVVIKGGNITAGTSAVQVYNGTANIEGGKFAATSSNVYVINCIDAKYTSGAAQVNITGGTYKGFNPADNAAEGAGTNFVAPGYASSEIEGTDSYEVVGDFVTNMYELNTAITNGKTHIYIGKDATIEGTFVMKDGLTIEGLEGASMHCVALNSASNITLKNITFDAENAKGSYHGKGARGGWANIISGTEDFKTGTPGSDIVIDGCTFTGTFENGGEAIAFTNQYRSVYGKVTIKNCTFETEGAYYHIYGHYFGMNELVIENNTFKTAVDPRCKPIYLNRYQSNNPVIIRKNTFEAVSTKDEAVHMLSHGASYVVSFEDIDNTFAN